MAGKTRRVKAPLRTKAHGIKFTDRDWKRIEETARGLGVTPAAFVNLATGFQVVANGGHWDGLLEQGRPQNATPQSEGDDNIGA